MCQILQRRFDFLGYTIENGSITPIIEKPQAVANFPVPSSRKATQRFPGLTSYFRKFVDGYAVISKPLSDLLRKNVELEFREL